MGAQILGGLTNNNAENVGCPAVKIKWRKDPNGYRGDNGSGTRTYDILRNDEVIVSGLAYGTTEYIDTTCPVYQTNTYKVCYNNGCGKSSVTSGENAITYPEPETAKVYKVIDHNGCVQNGIAIYYNNTNAQRNDLYKDGNLVVTDYISGSLYDAGDTDSHTYFLRAWLEVCSKDSVSFNFADGEDLRDVEYRDAVCVWRFDEGSGTVAGDSWGSYNGTLNGGASWTSGKSGNAILFDGVDDSVSIAGSSGLNLGKITVTAWINASSWQNEHWKGSIVTKDNWSPSTGWVLRCGDNGKLSFVISVNNTWNEAVSDPIMQLNQWVHVAGTYDGDKIRIYINGELKGEFDAADGEIDDSSIEIVIGRSAKDPSRIFEGVIDEVGIFERALSGEEILSLYQNGKYGDGIPNACDNCPYVYNEDQGDGDYIEGIVSAWHFNEGSGTIAEDTPGSNNGTLYNGVQWTTGYNGYGLSFDGVDDYVEVNHSPSVTPDNMTISAWIKADQWGPNIWSDTIVGKDDGSSGYALRCGENGRLSFVINIDGAWCEVVTGQIMQLGKWTYVAATYSQTENTIKVYVNGVEQGSQSFSGTYQKSTIQLLIGASPGFSGRLFQGKIDEVSIFSRVLDASEIKNIFENGLVDGVGDVCDDCPEDYNPEQEDRDYPLDVISAWHFDSGFANLAIDTPGANDSIVNGAQWVSGYRGSALQFDGVNDYVEVAHNSSLQPTTELTLMGWVKLVNPLSNQKIISKRPGNGIGYILGVTSEKIYPEIWDTNGVHYTFQSGTINSNEWTHLAVTWKSGEQMIGYINGSPVDSIGASSNPIIANNSVLTIGAASWNTNAFVVNGLVDEIAIFNRALTASEIMKVYQNGFNDGYADGCKDCAPGDIDVWGAPSAVINLLISKVSANNINWDEPLAPGSNIFAYDVLRSENASDFSSATCISSDITERTATDTEDPETVFYYLIRVENACGSNLGTDSQGMPRTGKNCP